MYKVDFSKLMFAPLVHDPKPALLGMFDSITHSLQLDPDFSQKSKGLVLTSPGSPRIGFDFQLTWDNKVLSLAKLVNAKVHRVMWDVGGQQVEGKQVLEFF